MKFCTLNPQWIPEAAAKFRWKILFRAKMIECSMLITKYLCYQYGVTYCSHSSGSDVCWHSQNNIKINRVVFSANDRALIKLLWQEKEYDAKKFVVEFPHKPWTLSRLNKWLPHTGHFTFWGNLTKAAVAIVCIDRFNWNLALWLPLDDALLM